MKPSNVLKSLELLHGINQPVFLWGASGVGKSDVVRQFCASQSLDLIDFRAIYREPVDMRGIPSITNGLTIYNPPAELPRTGNGILFLDELNSAPSNTQASCYQLVLDRAIGDYRLPDGWNIIAAGNRESDRGVIYRMPMPLANRFCHIDYEIDTGDWCKWAIQNHVSAEVVAFVRFRPELLHAFDPKSPDKAFPSPRSWTFVNRIFRQQPDPDIEAELYCGAVGRGAASEFTGFIRVFRNMPNPDGVLLNPAAADVPTEISALIALCTALGRRANDGNFDRVVVYAERLREEYGTMLVSDCITRDKELMNTKAFTLWASKHGNLI